MSRRDRMSNSQFIEYQFLRTMARRYWPSDWESMPVGRPQNPASGEISNAR